MLNKFFTWWNDVTPGAYMTIKGRGALVGEDEQGNRYFEARKATAEGVKRRWVIYKGVAEASRAPPDWHGWLHYVFDEPPSEKPLPRKSFETDHQPNMTGTSMAYYPKGSLAEPDGGAKLSEGYEAWSPDQS